MKVIDRIQSPNDRAVEALKAVLHQVSAIKLKEIDTDSAEPKSNADIVAHVDVYGHSHTLVCMMMSGNEPQSVSEAIVEFCDRALQLCDNATPVFIAPRFSEDALALCRENNAGFLDFNGNARIDLGEAFIARQLLPLVAEHPARTAPVQTSHRNVSHRLPPRRAEILSPAVGALA
jgi:hypothetical protein